MVEGKLQRCCNEYSNLIAEIRAHYILQGRRPPSASHISKMIIRKYKISKEALLYDKTIKL